MSVEEEFDAAMHDNYTLAGRETGYWGHYFLRSVRKNGGLVTAKRMLAKSGPNGKTKGFAALVHAGRPDLSVEALVLSPRFSTLFSTNELQVAQERLAEFPDYARRRSVPVDKVFPEMVTDESFPEGHTHLIAVNRYERSRSARAACIKRHGTRCAVCSIDFEERYGSIGRGFIHIHHRKPLAMREVMYRVDPVRDLVPVCPNCHAMLHTSEPPKGIEELKQVLVGGDPAPKRRRANP